MHLKQRSVSAVTKCTHPKEAKKNKSKGARKLKMLR